MDGPSKPRAPPKRPPPESDQAPTDRPGQRGALPPDGDTPALTARRPYPNWSSLTNWRIAAASGPTFGVPSSRVGPNDVLLRAASEGAEAHRVGVHRRERPQRIVVSEAGGVEHVQSGGQPGASGRSRHRLPGEHCHRDRMS
jgi:hypothetical protein